MRGGLALAALVMGYAGITSALANAIVDANPAAAHTLAPSNGIVTAKLAEQQFASTSEAAAPQAADLAQEALWHEPTAVEALAVLGLQAQLRGESTAAARLFAQSNRLSRRELPPRFWAIEEAVGRGDIATALEHYDIALKTSTRAQDTLFPILSAAIDQPKVRAGLLPILANEPNWGAAFLTFAATSGSDPLALTQLIREGSKANLPIDANIRTNLVNSLVAKGLVGPAWDYYSSFRGTSSKARSRDPEFVLTDNEARTAFDWALGTSTGTSTAMLSKGDSGVFDFAAAPGSGGLLLQQLQVLPAGIYRLEGTSAGIDLPERSRPYWSLSCIDGRELGRVVVPDPQRNAALFGGRMTVPSDCPVQTLALIARPVEGLTGLTGQIESVQLAPDTASDRP